MGHMTATDGAYGRRFTNAADVLKHWNANKDFLNETMGTSGTYISKSDFLRYSTEDTMKLRYNHNRDSILVSKANPDEAVTEDGEPLILDDQGRLWDVESQTFLDDPSEGERPDQDYMGTGMDKGSLAQFLADELGGTANEYDI